MAQESLWQRFERLSAASGAEISVAVATEETSSHLLIKGASGEPIFLMRCEERKTPRTPIRLKHVAVNFDVPFEVRLSDVAPATEARYTKFTCAPESVALHRLFVELVSTVTRRFRGPLSTKDVDDALASMLELFRQTTPPEVTTVVGLWGELLAIQMADNKKAFVHGWHAALTDVFDFSIGEMRLEVKTTLGSNREHEFSLSQIRGGRIGDYVVSVLLQRSSAGLSVIDLAKMISEDLDDPSSERLWRQVIETLGPELDGVEDQRFDLEVAMNSAQVYRAAQIPAPIIAPEWESLVSNVRFKVSLGALGRGTPVGPVLRAGHQH